MLTVITIAFIVAISAVCLFAMCAPIETIAWWRRLGSSRSPVDSPVPGGRSLPDGSAPARREPADQYVVYLSGVGRSSGEEVPEKEGEFLNMVEQAVPGLVLVRDVFPYSPSGTPLTEHRPLVRFWKWIPQTARRNRRLMVLYHIIYFNNLLRVAVSRDPRYGPAFSYGTAKEILRGLVRNGYRIDLPRPVTILCISGGGQVAQAAAPYLKRWLGQPIRILSIGSVMTDETGTRDVAHIYHLSGSKDVTQYVGRLLGPGCWPVFPNSTWNRAVAEGRIETIPVGPMKHMGWGDYFSRSVRLPDGRSHAEFVAEVVSCLLRGQSHRGYRPAEADGAEGRFRPRPAKLREA